LRSVVLTTGPHGCEIVEVEHVVPAGAECVDRVHSRDPSERRVGEDTVIIAVEFEDADRTVVYERAPSRVVSDRVVEGQGTDP
jgi:hypothetical protein